MKLPLLLFVLLTICLMTGCTASVKEPELPLTHPESQWIPPAHSDAPSSKAQSVLNALDLCAEFVREMEDKYPDYAPVLSADDEAYFRTKLCTPDADTDALSSELVLTISALRQQIYQSIENTRKTGNALPDGLEAFLTKYEQRFRAIGW